MQANGQVEESFDEHSIQRKIEEITGALKEALDAEEHASTENDRTPRKMLPSTACALVGECGWWLSRGSVGSASSKCGESAVWCRHVVQRWRNRAASRLHRYRGRRRLRILSRLAYCERCEILLNGAIMFADHLIGKKHINNERRRTMLPKNIVRRNFNQQRFDFLGSFGLVGF